MDDQPETGVNKQYSQAEATKDSDKVKIGVSDPKYSFNTSEPGAMPVSFHVDEKLVAHIIWEGQEVGKISLKDGKTIHFEGNMDDSAASLLILLKKFIDNWLLLKK